jgi:hypothetical protein
MLTSARGGSRSQQQASEEARRRYTEVPCDPWDLVFNYGDPEDGVVLKPEDFDSYYAFLDADPNVQTAMHFRMDAILNGGILFTRNGNTASSIYSEFLTQTYSKLARDIIRQRWATGIVSIACVPHKQHKGVPVCVDQRNFEIRMYTDLLGRQTFRYFIQGSHQEKIEVRNISTYVYSAPNTDGSLRSLMGLLQSDYIQEQHLTICDMIATKNRAMPIMITEIQAEKYNPQEITAAMTPEQNKVREQQRLEKLKQNNAFVLPVKMQSHNYLRGVLDQAGDSVSEKLDPIFNYPFYSSHAKLDQGRTFVAAPLPEAPGEQLLKFRVARQERAYTLLGVPLAMVSNNTSTGGTKIGGAASSSNPNSFVLFDNAQQALKKDLINIMQAVINRIQMPSLVDKYLQDTKPSEIDLDECEVKCTIKVELPSVPDEDKLIQWYTLGILSLEAMQRYLGSKHGIPEEAWNKTPEVTVPELNGVAPEEPAAKKKKK